MAKKAPKRKLGGPFLSAAFLCENLLTDKDGVRSAIRIVDVINISVTNAPANMDISNVPATVNLKVFISLKPGDSKGMRTLEIRPNYPDGKKGEPSRLPIELVGGHRGSDIAIDLALKVIKAGVLWIDVRLDGKLLTKMPLAINYQRAEPQASSAQPPGKRKSS